MARTGVVLLMLAAGGFLHAACSTDRAASDQYLPAESSSSRRMPDGKRWTTENVRLEVGSSFCYDDSEANCVRYGRLYPWESAQRACASMGRGWRLPTDYEWRELGNRYGGVGEDSADGGKAAYRALLSGGTSGFNAMLGGDRDHGKFNRLEAHGFYWTATETTSGNALFYNFGKGGQALHRQAEGDKQMAASVRCVTE